MEAHCRIELLGWLRIIQDGRAITRFRTQKNGAMLAYLAYHLDVTHPREVLIELFWPEAKAGRDSLNQAVSTLRHLLEPTGTEVGTVLLADRQTLQLNPLAVHTDVRAFESGYRAALRAEENAQAGLLAATVALYRGELLPGYYEDWISLQRKRLAELYLDCLRRLTRISVDHRDYHQALDYARLALSIDTLSERSHRELMRLYMASGQPAAALEQLQILEHTLQEEMGAAPSQATRELAEQISQMAGSAGIVIIRPPKNPAPAKAATKNDSLSNERKGKDVPAPPVVPAVPTPGYIPMRFSRFFGRETEIARLLALLTPKEPEEETVRLVTLLGAGGCGKTRLSQELAERIKDTWEDAVWFVSLEDVIDARRIPDVILETLRLPRDSRQEALDQVTGFLAERPALLILDNFEQLIGRGASIVLSLLRRLPRLTLLVTSRRPLALSGEQEFPIEPLPVPEENEPMERMWERSSVRMFVDRAQARRPDFTLTPRNAPTLARLCRYMEGIPLAIELAAARIQSLSPSQMLERWQQRFEILSNARMDKNFRHHSLRTTIDWSYHLLTPELRRFCARLSVFRGGWTAEAAALVCLDEGGEENESRALDFLSQLRSHSLILIEEAEGGEIRFRMLETLREFAEEQIRDEATEVAVRHRHCFLDLAKRAEIKMAGSELAEWLSRLEADHDNLRVALERAIATGAAEEGVLMAGMIWRFWEVRGHLREGRSYLEQLLALPGTEGLAPGVLGKAYNGCGIMAWNLGDYAGARKHLEAGLEIARRMNHRRGMAAALNNLGLIAVEQGDYEAGKAYYAESLAIKRSLEDKQDIALLLHNLGVIARKQNDHPAATKLYDESLALYRELNNSWGIALSLINQGILATEEGDFKTAWSHLEESLRLERELGHRQNIANALHSLGRLVRLEKDWERARLYYQESLELLQAVGDIRYLTACMEEIAFWASDTGASRQAVVFHGFTSTQRLALGTPLTAYEIKEVKEQLARLEIVLTTSEFEAAYAEGTALSIEQVTALAYALLLPAELD